MRVESPAMSSSPSPGPSVLSQGKGHETQLALAVDQEQDRSAARIDRLCDTLLDLGRSLDGLLPDLDDHVASRDALLGGLTVGSDLGAQHALDALGYDEIHTSGLRERAEGQAEIGKVGALRLLARLRLGERRLRILVQQGYGGVQSHAL